MNSSRKEDQAKDNPIRPQDCRKWVADRRFLLPATGLRKIRSIDRTGLTQLSYLSVVSLVVSTIASLAFARLRDAVSDVVSVYHYNRSALFSSPYGHLPSDEMFLALVTSVWSHFGVSPLMSVEMFLFVTYSRTKPALLFHLWVLEIKSHDIVFGAGSGGNNHFAR